MQAYAVSNSKKIKYDASIWLLKPKRLKTTFNKL